MSIEDKYKKSIDEFPVGLFIWRRDVLKYDDEIIYTLLSANASMETYT